MPEYFKPQLGAVPPLILVAIIAIVGFLFVNSYGPFKDNLLSRLYPKPPSQAAECTSSLQTKIDAAVSGSTVTADACIYRQTVTVNKPIILDGKGIAEIRGSDIWSSWVGSGPWVSSQTVPSFFTHGECNGSSNGRCLWAEQVFYDGKPLYQVSSSSTPIVGQFKVDSSRKVVLADNPSGHIVEVTTRTKWATIASDNVTLQGFMLKHSANDSQNGGVTNKNGSTSHNNLTIQNSNLSDAHGSVLSISGGSGHKILNNDISYGGQMGIHAPGSLNSTFQGNKIHHNNTEEFNAGWEAGGTKFASGITNVVIDNNEAYENDGPGLWCDIDCKNITISNNRVYRNKGVGIFFEISDGAKIFGNKVWKNALGGGSWGYNSGILISSSKNAEVYNNIVAWQNDQIIVLSQNRGSNWGQVTGNFIHDNQLFAIDATDSDPDRNHTFALGYLQDWAGVIFNAGSNNHGANNQYWFNNPEGSTAVKYPRYAWSSNYNKIASFNATPGEENGRYLSDSEKDQILGGNCMPKNASDSDPCPMASPSVAPSLAPNPTPTPTPTPSSIPASEKAIPAKIEAEDFETGGEGVGYHDLDLANNGGAYRTNEAVDIKTTAEGGYAIGWFQNSEWLKYSVSASNSGSFDFQFRTGSIYAGRYLNLEVDGINKGSVGVPVVGGWDQYQTVIIPAVSLAAGNHTVKVYVTGADYADFNWLNVVQASASTPTPTPTPTDTTLPTVSIISPVNGATLTRNSYITINASASDNVGVTRVLFYQGSNLICTDTTASYSCPWKIPGKRNATYTLKAISYDGAGNASLPSTVTVTAK